jgi:NOL1/NOP2/fmu family ribosome biogenesis protein
MTNLGTITLVLVCVGVGYIIEPVLFELRNADRNKSKEEPKAEKTVKIKQKKPKPAPPKIDIDLSLIKPEDFPQTVSLRETFEISQDGLTLKLEEGAQLTPVRLEGTDLVFQTNALGIEHRIDVDQTDFKQQVLPVMNARLQREEEMRRIEAAKPVILDAEGIVSCIRASVEAGQVTEFKVEQVSNWEAGEDMEFDGQNYQTGWVTYEAQTIIGTQVYKAIGLIDNGEVVKWIAAKTRLELR